MINHKKYLLLYFFVLLLFVVVCAGYFGYSKGYRAGISCGVEEMAGFLLNPSYAHRVYGYRGIADGSIVIDPNFKD